MATTLWVLLWTGDKTATFDMTIKVTVHLQGHGRLTLATGPFTRWPSSHTLPKRSIPVYSHSLTFNLNREPYIILWLMMNEKPPPISNSNTNLNSLLRHISHTFWWHSSCAESVNLTFFLLIYQIKCNERWTANSDCKAWPPLFGILYPL